MIKRDWRLKIMMKKILFRKTIKLKVKIKIKVNLSFINTKRKLMRRGLKMLINWYRKFKWSKKRIFNKRWKSMNKMNLKEKIQSA